MNPRDINRIRCPRDNPRSLTPEAHRASFLLPHADPAYPDDAVAAGIEGTVILDLRISAEGALESVSVREGHPLLAESALQAVREWRFRPVKPNGKPVAVNTDLYVTFALPGAISLS